MQADKSAYWLPQLYWHEEKNTTHPFTPLRINFRFYYRLARNSPAQYVAPFPKGLRAIGGNMNLKQMAPNLKFMCHRTRALESTPCNGFKCGSDCPFGYKVEVFLPQCWDGYNLWLDGAKHLAYPYTGIATDQVQNGQCPWSHPIRIPQIMLEGTWFPSDIAPGQSVDNHLIWAFGDKTGFGLHGDFVNGWDQAILKKALETKGTCVDQPNGETSIQDCPVFAPSYSEAAAKACKLNRAYLKEPFDNIDKVPIPRLPGCNPVWDPSQPKPTCNPAIPGLDVRPYQAPMGPTVADAGDQRKFQWPTGSGWKKIECFKADAFDHVFPNPSSVFLNPLTLDKCQNYCLARDYRYAAVGQRGNTFSCVCGKELKQSAPVYPGMCEVNCPGNASQKCGGMYSLQVYWAGDGTPKPPLRRSFGFSKDA